MRLLSATFVFLCAIYMVVVMVPNAVDREFQNQDRAVERHNALADAITDSIKETYF